MATKKISWLNKLAKNNMTDAVIAAVRLFGEPTFMGLALHITKVESILGISSINLDDTPWITFESDLIVLLDYSIIEQE